MPDLYRELHPEAVIPPSIPTEYPKWVEGQDGARALVHSASQESEVTGRKIAEPESDRCETVNALFTAHQPTEQQETIGEKALLQLEASNMGIEVDRRWGVKKLRAVIEAHS